MGRRVTAYLSDELNTRVNVERVSIQFVRSVVLKGLYIEDKQGDTLLYAGELSIAINDISTKDQSLKLGRVILRNGQFNLVHYKGEEHDNLYFLTEYLASEPTADTSQSAPWLIRIADIAFDNVGFKHEIQDDTAFVDGLDFSHLDIKNIYGRFSDFHIINDSIFADIHNLAFADKSGFTVNEFSADAKFSQTEIRLQKLIIRTPGTEILSDLTFHYDSLPCFDEFTSQVKWQATFSKSDISFSDIAFFATDLKGINKAIQLNGNFKGSVNNFKGKNVEMKWGSKSFFRGNIAMNGLPVISETFVDANAEEIQTNKNDIEWLPAAPFEDQQTIKIPDNLSTLGTVVFKGKFTGFFSDFVAYGNVSTAIGSIRSDLNLKINESSKSSVYSGHLSATRFDLGKLINSDELGQVTFNLDLKGSGMKLDNIDAKLDGKINQLHFHGYDYHNIAVDGQLSKKLFSGSVVINESNVDLDFRGTIDYRNKLPAFDFTAKINSLRMDSINLAAPGTRTIYSTTIRTRFEGDKLDNIVGNIDFDNTDIITGKQQNHINSIKVRARKYDLTKTFDIESDNLNAHFTGEFELAALGDAFKEILPRYLPSVVLPKKTTPGRQNFTFDIRIKNLDLVSEKLFPDWRFAPNTSIKGNFNSIDYDFDLNIVTEWMKFKNYTFENFNLSSMAGQKNMSLSFEADRINTDDRQLVDRPIVKANAHNNQIDFVVRLADNDSSENRSHLEGRMNFNSASSFDLHIDSSFIVIENNRWYLDHANNIRFDTSTIVVSSLNLSNGSEAINLDGTISKVADEKFGLQFSNFNLANVNQFIGSGNNFLQGIIDGEVYLNDAYDKFQVESNLNISNFSIDGDTIGNAAIRSQYLTDKKVVVADVSFTKGTAKIIDIKGNYFVSREEDNLDFTIKLNNLYLHPIERYISEVMRDIYGKITADLKLTGTFEKPVINGTADLNKTSLIVNYFNTRYSFNTSVKISKNKFKLDELKLLDEYNNEGVISGEITHDYFKNFRFDVELQADNLHILNTTIDDNILYYGTAYATGYGHFVGPLENMAMDISLTPDKGTIINIPLNTYDDLSGNSFITFIDRSKSTGNEVAKSQVDLSGIKLNMNLDMNRNADINIIFDEKIGDKISATGSGSIRLDINTAGNFNMYGSYSIEKGDYLFTLQNLINKKFIIDWGSRITWAGDPYEATVDLSAVYMVYTSTLYNVLQDSSYKRRVPVECRLKLTNKLMNPIINYEIRVEGLGPTEEGMLRTVLNSEQEINRQFFGLLFLNQFLPASSGGQTAARVDAGAGAGASASELLSNQVSNWLGQLSKDVNIGLDYHARDQYTNEEIKLIFSKTILDGRLDLIGKFGYSDQNYANSNVVGEFYAEYKVSQDGRFRLKGFNRSNTDDILNYSQSPYTQGLGFFYRQEFSDLLVKLRLKSKKKTDEKEQVNQ